MAKVTVKFRPSTVPGKQGSIYYQISHGRRAMQITTHMKLHPWQWERLNDHQANFPDEQMQHMLMRINCDKELFRQIVQMLDNSGADYGIDDIAMMFRSPEKRVSLTVYANQLITQLAARNRLGTARNYRRTLNSINNFLKGADVPMSTFDYRIVESYNYWLQVRGVMRNTISFYMRILRSIYNKAVLQHITEQTYPFRNVYTGVDRTQKRAMTEQALLRLKNMKLEPKSQLAMTRDIFIFSYCMRGMSFVDMAYLRKCDIMGDTIHYVRRKTGQPLSVKVEPCIREIIERYWSCDDKSQYVFPLIVSEEPGEAYAQYQAALSRYNNGLRRLSELLGLEPKLSSYASRHTWATTARNHRIPISVISAGMGHTSERTTQIYLASLEASIIDNANRSLIAILDGKRKPRDR